MTTTNSVACQDEDQDQDQEVKPALSEEHFSPVVGPEVLTARADLADLLEKYAGELRTPPRPQAPGRRTPELIEDTQDYVLQVETLLEAMGRKLTRLERAARTEMYWRASAFKRVCTDKPQLPLDTLRRLYVDQRQSSAQIGKKFGKDPSDINLVLTSAGIPLRRRRRPKVPRVVDSTD